jgi:hypothetical protein
MATWREVSQVFRKLESFARDSINWSEKREQAVDPAKTEVALVTCRRGEKMHLRQKLTAKIQVGNGYVRSYKDATRWLGVWMDAHLTFMEHLTRCMKKARAAEARLRSLTRSYGVIPACVRAVQVA